MTDYAGFWFGIDSGFPLCCIDFFETFWRVVRTSQVEEFHITENWFTDPDNTGRIYCPECMIKKMKN